MTEEKGTAPTSGTADPAQGTVIRVAKPEEGSAKGEIWVVMRALIVLACGIFLLGYIIG